MFAIVEVGGKQYRVEEGGEIVVDRLDAAEGKTVELRPLLVADGSEVRFAGEGKMPKVTADVVGHLRGPKVTISRFKPKRGWRKKTGFRSALTRLEVKNISVDGKKSVQEAPTAETSVQVASPGVEKTALATAPAKSGAANTPATKATAAKKTVKEVAPAKVEATKTPAAKAPAAKKSAPAATPAKSGVTKAPAAKVGAAKAPAAKKSAPAAPKAKKSTQEG
jgi:large subunit ribosomal protein L21